MPKLRVEIVLALPAAVERVVLELPEGSRAGEAAWASGLPARLGIDAANLHLGIGGRKLSLLQALRDGDRLEILRPLQLDPKEARRRRARRTRGRRA